MHMIEATLLYDARATLGEGPVWKEDEQALYWLDIMGCMMHRLIPGSDEPKTEDRFWETPMPIGCFTFTRDNRVLAAGRNGFGYLTLNLDMATFEPLVDPEEDKPGNRFNDGKCDPAGRFFAGSMGFTGEDRQPAGAFYAYDTDGTCRKLLEPVGISNGLAWSADSRTLYYIDTTARTLSAFDYDLDTGTIDNRRILFDFSEGPGHPDGMTIDRDGNLWVCFYGGGRVLCVNPDTRESLAEITVPAPCTTSCCFGGPDYRTLFITTARAGSSEEQLSEYPNAGGIFCADTGAQGLPFSVYGG